LCSLCYTSPTFNFPSTYLVEKEFSVVVQLLTKQINQLDIYNKGMFSFNQYRTRHPHISNYSSGSRQSYFILFFFKVKSFCKVKSNCFVKWSKI
jgi:hypothetical protein